MKLQNLIDEAREAEALISKGNYFIKEVRDDGFTVKLLAHNSAIPFSKTEALAYAEIFVAQKVARLKELETAIATLEKVADGLLPAV